MSIGHTVDQKSENLIGNIMKTTFFLIIQIFSALPQEKNVLPNQEKKPKQEKTK